MNHLLTQIKAENAVNTLIKARAPRLFEAAKGLVGKQILKADGSLRKDALAVLDVPTFPDRHDMIYLSRSSSSLAFTFKASAWTKNEREHMSDHCSYSETTVYIGDMQNGLLESLEEFDPSDYKSDYDLETIKDLRAKCEEARKAYEQARSDCNPFGER